MPAGAPLFRVDGRPRAARRRRALPSASSLGLERTLDQDVAYGFRLLVDMAERSLAESPFLDPTTAVQAIDRLHDCLRQLARRPFPDGRHRDAEGQLRLIVPVDELGRLRAARVRGDPAGGRRSPQVTRRLEDALRDLRSITPPERRPVIDQQLARLAKAATAAGDDDDVKFALDHDRKGIGVAATLS